MTGSLFGTGRLRLAGAVALLGLLSLDARAQISWAFAPGAYTHSPLSGVRVAQYAQHEPVEGLPDPRQTVSRYWRSQTNLRGIDGSTDTIYEVRSFGNTLGGFDAQRERGFDAQLETLDALRPFRFNPYLFFGGMQGFGYGYPGYPASVPGTPVPTPQGNFGGVPYGGAWQTPLALPPGGDCVGEGCAGSPPVGTSPAPSPAPGLPGTAYPYAPLSGFVAPPFPYALPYPLYGYGYGAGHGLHGHHPQPWWGYGPGRQSYFQGGGW